MSISLRRSWLGTIAAWVAAGIIVVGIVLSNVARSAEESASDAKIPPISSGYGANGPYSADIETVDNPTFSRKPVLVFLPHGLSGKRPVIFFAHGYGPGDWQTNDALIEHIVSLGYVVVFSSYPMVLSDMNGRYDALWKGCQAAADTFGDRMDLTRVGFVGHSFGGGATPAMAYRGIVQNKWGSNGAFLMELAPWYAYQITNTQLTEFPSRVVLAVEAYDNDSVNDHRIGIDLYKNTPVTEKYYFLVQSATIDGNKVVADHATPGRNISLRQKQYGVFRPFDALADEAFNGSVGAHNALQTMCATAAPSPGQGTVKTEVYQPLRLETDPTPDHPESFYRNPWSNEQNPRRPSLN